MNALAACQPRQREVSGHCARDGAIGGGDARRRAALGTFDAAFDDARYNQARTHLTCRGLVCSSVATKPRRQNKSSQGTAAEYRRPATRPTPMRLTENPVADRKVAHIVAASDNFAAKIAAGDEGQTFVLHLLILRATHLGLGDADALAERRRLSGYWRAHGDRRRHRWRRRQRRIAWRHRLRRRRRWRWLRQRHWHRRRRPKFLPR